MARPLLLSDQTLAGGLRRDAVGDERYQSFRSLENFDIVYSPTVSLRRRERFAAYLSDWKPPSSIINLFATTLKTDDLTEVDVLYVVQADGKIFRYYITEPAVTITGAADTNGFVTFTSGAIPNSTTDTLPLSVGDYILVSGSEIEMLDSNNEVIEGSIDTFDGFHELTTVGTHSVITATTFPTGTPTGTFGTYYRIATLIHNMASNAPDISGLFNKVEFKQVGDSVYFSTWAKDAAGYTNEKGWYVDHLNVRNAMPANPQVFPEIIPFAENNNTARNPDRVLDLTNSFGTVNTWVTGAGTISAVAFDTNCTILGQQISLADNNVTIFDIVYLPITIGIREKNLGVNGTQAAPTYYDRHGKGNLKVFLVDDDGSGAPDWDNVLAESGWFLPKAQVVQTTNGDPITGRPRQPLGSINDPSAPDGWNHVSNWVFRHTKFGAGALWVDSDFWLIVQADEAAYSQQTTDPDSNLDTGNGGGAQTWGSSGYWWWTNDNYYVSGSALVSLNPAGMARNGVKVGSYANGTSVPTADEKPTGWTGRKNQEYNSDWSGANNTAVIAANHPVAFILGQSPNLATKSFYAADYDPAVDSLYDDLKFAVSFVKTDITSNFEGQLDLINNQPYAETRVAVPNEPSTFKPHYGLHLEKLPATSPTAADSLGYPWATHYRLYRQLSSADPSWIWLCDLPLDKIGKHTHIAVSKVYQGLTDPRIYLLENEDERPISPTSVEVWNERLWLIDGRKLRFSARAESNSRLAAIGEPIYNSFPLLNVIEFSEPITGLSVFSDRLVVFFKNNIKIIGGGSSVLNPPPDLITADIVKNEGTERTEAIIAMKGGIVFVNQFGQVKLFNGSENTIDLSEPIQSLWETFGRNTTMFSTYYNEQLMIAVDTGGDNIIDKLYVLDMGRTRASWRVYDYSTNKLTAIVRSPSNQLLGAIDTGTEYKIVILGGRTNETYLETSVTAEAETHPVPSPNISTWTKFELQGNYPSSPPSFAVTATAKDGTTSTKTVTPLNDNDVRGHSGGLRIRSNECSLKIVTSGTNLDEVRSLTLA